MTKPDANGWISIYNAPLPHDGEIRLYWDEILGVIHGFWCEYDGEYSPEWEFHSFGGDFLPDADPVFWQPLPEPPVDGGAS